MVTCCLPTTVTAWSLYFYNTFDRFYYNQLQFVFLRTARAQNFMKIETHRTLVGAVIKC